MDTRADDIIKNHLIKKNRWNRFNNLYSAKENMESYGNYYIAA